MSSSQTNIQTPLRYKQRTSTISTLNRGQQTTKIKGTNSFHSSSVTRTPPAKPFYRVVNPFEAALSDRLHLPLIGSSPTLFQQSRTPQHNSTQFTWTIEDVSSLKPAIVEAHESQFEDVTDPEYEAKAQSAISIYFKEHEIVPSPIDCPLRNQRIDLTNIYNNTPVCKPGRRIRDSGTQTVLSLPSVLPKELEEALAPYFNCNDNENNVSSSRNDGVDYDARDISLRRKLFDYQLSASTDNESFDDRLQSCALTVNSPAPESPQLTDNKTTISDKPLDDTSFGLLSPIAQESPAVRARRFNRFNVIRAPETAGLELEKEENITTPHLDESYMTPLQVSRDSANRNSIDSSVNVKISRLFVDSAKRINSAIGNDLFDDNDENIHLSQLSASSQLSVESSTPRSKRRSPGRKNLSQSFSLHSSLSNSNEDEYEYNSPGDPEQEPYNEDVDADVTEPSSLLNKQENCEHSSLHPTDSGFNEMTNSVSQYDIKLSSTKTYQLYEEVKTEGKRRFDAYVEEDPDADVSMICCSTPSKRHAFE